MKPNEQSSGYQPIENYGIVGDLNTVALIGLNGSVDFMCFPDFDSPTVFAAMLDKDKGGFFRIYPKSGTYKEKQLYLPDTNILLTRFLSEDGIGEITDCMPVQELNRGNELIRKVISVKGKISYQLNCRPRFNYARARHEAEQINDHEVIFSCSSPELKLRLKSTVKLLLEENDCYAEFELDAGESAEFMLIHADKHAPGQKDMKAFIETSFKENANFWKDWIGRSTYKGRWMEMVNRSALMLKIMTSFKHGSLVAAPTFGLPEQIGGERNWDYRFTWIRDASFTVYCLLNLGYTREARNFISWIQYKCLDIGKKKKLQLMYKLDGGTCIKEKKLNYLEGYKRSEPVRIGNAAEKQVQLDIYGELMDAVYLYDRDGEPIAYDFWLDLTHQIEWVAQNWDVKDDGIWEIRGKKKKFLYSRMMCWVALDRAIKIAGHHSYPLPDSWKTERDKIFEVIHKNFWNSELKSFVQYEQADIVDASTLMMPIVGFISALDPKWLNTQKLIEERLVNDCLVYRYINKHDGDGLKGTEGTFSMCSFWYIHCLSLSGELDKALLYFEKMIGYANHLGLYAEQLGFSGEQLGNFPQAFTHLGLISAAINLDKQLNDTQNKQTD